MFKTFEREETSTQTNLNEVLEQKLTMLEEKLQRAQTTIEVGQTAIDVDQTAIDVGQTAIEEGVKKLIYVKSAVAQWLDR